MLNDVYKEAETRMKGAIQALEEDLGGIRTGRASPALIERLQVEYYGALTPLIQLASISVIDPPVRPGFVKGHRKGDISLRPGVDA